MSQENVEVVRTWLAPWDGVDAVAVFRDDATWTSSRAEFEAFFESDYAIAWIAQGQRVLEASGWDDSRRGWLEWLEPTPQPTQLRDRLGVEIAIAVVRHGHPWGHLLNRVLCTEPHGGR